MVFAKGTVSKSTKEEENDDIAASWLMLDVMQEVGRLASPECMALVSRNADEREEAFLVCTGSCNPQSSCCHSEDIVFEYKDGDCVCSNCGQVQAVPIYVDPFSMSNTFIQNYIFQSSYKRIHYCNERIYQWLCRDAWQMHPAELKELRLILASYTTASGKTNHSLTMTATTTTICGGPDSAQTLHPGLAKSCEPPNTTPHSPPVPSYSKTRIRMALRKMGRPKFIEKWVTIQCQLTKERPPNPDDEVKFPFMGCNVKGVTITLFGVIITLTLVQIYLTITLFCVTITLTLHPFRYTFWSTGCLGTRWHVKMLQMLQKCYTLLFCFS